MSQWLRDKQHTHREREREEMMNTRKRENKERKKEREGACRLQNELKHTYAWGPKER